MGTGKVKVKMVPIGNVIPYARNPRRNEKAIDMVAASIKEYGWRQPIVVDEEMVIIAGHTRLEAARKLGEEKVPIHVAEGLTPAQIKAYRIADNKSSENAEWDAELLKLEFDDLKLEDFDLQLTGFSDDELESLLKAAVTVLPPAADPDEGATSIPEEPVSVLGDLYEIGEHRLLCGDSTISSELEFLMGADKASIIFTDPPYGVSYGGGRARGNHARGKKGGVLIKAHGEILGDDKTGDDLIELVRDALSNAVLFSAPDRAAYICFPWKTYTEFLEAVQQSGLDPKACIVWDKGSIGLGTAHYRPQHELIFYCPGETWNGEKDQSDVWNFSRGNTGDYVHPTQKPVELVEKALKNSSNPGDIVLDVFGGSGSTMVAAHKNGRTARLIEKDPKYCDAIVKRMHKLWPDLVIRKNGTVMEFDDEDTTEDASL